ncbi:sugar phosphate isomerase/epimerase [Caldifermentibacillus hisashii]|uniref:sugar phosphate isomerase/epimerase family protein n=1 Tax=Caldifermentibacillus hisashii TaxID=996558 RepID=UPI0031FDD815
MKEIPVSVQLYTLREQCEKDFEGTLKRVAELGYDGVEFAGLYGRSAKEIRNLLDRLGLKASSSHVPLQELKNDLTKVIEEQKTLGSTYIICPFLMPDERNEPAYQGLISFLKDTGERVRKEGLVLGYHNHDFELERLNNGKTVLETILDGAQSVIAEFDIYWLKKAGENPVEWIEKYMNRVPIVHLKDMTTDQLKSFAELGTGGVDLETVLSLGEKAGINWWVVEQDICQRDPFKSIEMSLNYLKTKLPYLNK